VKVNYNLTRSNRKSVVLYVRDNGIEVRAPLKMQRADIDKFVASKEKWIADKLALLSERKETRDNFTLNYGDTVTYRNQKYLISAREGNRMGCDNESFYMPENLTNEEIKYTCIAIYRMLAKRDLTKKVFDFSKTMGVVPAAVKISNAKTRWGSCSGKNSLNFSWRLIMADDDVIDYVVIHELAHIKELNHSERFWAIVQEMLPDYRERRERLKQLQRKLNNEDWDYNKGFFYAGTVSGTAYI